MPTASSAQISKSARRIAPQIAIRPPALLIRLSTSSQESPVASNNSPITIKSSGPQSTSVVNCIATNGIDRIIATVRMMAMMRLFFIIVIFWSTYDDM